VRITRWTRDLCYAFANRHDKRRWDLEVKLDGIERQIEALEDQRDAIEIEINRERRRCYDLREQARGAA